MVEKGISGEGKSVENLKARSQKDSAPETTLCTSWLAEGRKWDSLQFINSVTSVDLSFRRRGAKRSRIAGNPT